MKKFLNIIIVLSCFAAFTSCGDTASNEATKPAEAAHEDEHENTNTATLTDEQIKTIGIELGSIEEKQLTASLKTNGTLKVPNQNKASVNSVTVV